MNKKKDEKKKAETTCGTTSSQGESQGGQQNNGCCISGLNGSKDSIANDYIKELLKSVEIKDCKCCGESEYMKKFVEESIKSLKESGKRLIKEIEKIPLNDNENTIEDVKLLKEYTHQVLWFLISYVAVEEYILICNWLCRLKEYLCEIIKCIRTQVTGEGKMCCGHLSDTENNENCICRIFCNIICLLIKSINRLHEHKREIILRKNEPTAADCDCECCTQTNGRCKTCTCVKNVQKMEDEFFTVSTKSLDNIRSTILIFYGMEKMIGKYEGLCNKGTDGKCACKDKSDKYAECLSLFSVCFNILKDLSSMKDGILPMAVTWLSNCLKFVGEKVEVEKCPLVTDADYQTRKNNYECRSKENKEKVDTVKSKYETMINAAKDLRSLQGENNVQNGGTSCSNNTACTTTTEGSGGSTCSGQPCNCKCEECTCPNNLDTKDGVFNKLCEMMCCNGTTCTCSNGSPGKCNSISTFCKEVDHFMTLVKEVKKNGAPAQESTSTPTPPTCECKEKNCEYCKTCRFIRLVEEYTKQLKEKHECKSENGCECCKEDTENCLKDGYKCGISHVMKIYYLRVIYRSWVSSSVIPG